ncbi:MAG TPA: peptide ABC transporter substrate-binding protein [Ktedonobacterales bacterium]|nr:peptide ABC transporter substrate-binding protein [Ktedonobacterales bacterium]
MRLGLRRVSLVGLLVISALSLMLAACGSTTTNGGKAPDSKQVLTRYIVANKLDVKTVDPAVVTDFYSYFPIYLTFPGLVTLNDKLEVVPWAADSAPTVSADGKTYTFKVKSGLKWSDGTAIDANTFAYSINRSVDPCTASPVGPYYLAIIKDVATFSGEKCADDGKTITGKIQTLVGDSLVVSDPQTLQITLESPAAYFPDAMTYPTSFAQPKQLIDQFGNKGWTDHLVDNGGFGGNLFKITAWDHKGSMTLTRNDSFWGTKPVLKQINFKIYKDGDTEYADFQSGHLDVGSPPNTQYAAAKSVAGFHENPSLSIGYLQPNWKAAPFDDLAARQAFAIAIDKDALANQVDKGTVLPTNHIVPQGMPGYNPNLTGPDGTQNVKGDAAKALALITDYANRKCGGKIASCPPVTLTESNDPDIVASGTAIIDMWTKNLGGYPVKLTTTDFSSLLDQAYSPNPPQIFGIGWITDYPDPQDWLSLQFSATASNNTGAVSVPEANDLMAKADANQDPTSRIQQYQQAEQLLVTDVAWVPLSQGKQIYIVKPYVQGYSLTSLGYPTLDTWSTVYVNNH